MHRLSRAIAATPGLAAVIFTGPALAQTLGQGDSHDIAWWRVGGALALCLLLAVAAGLALRMRQGGGARLSPGKFASLPGALRLLERGPRTLQLVETLRLSHQLDICLIRWEGRDYLIAAGPQGATLLAERDAPPPPTPAEGA